MRYDIGPFKKLSKYSRYIFHMFFENIFWHSDIIIIKINKKNKVDK